eukprot:TRINITY_DN1486_c0_g1_i1.p1 TRINITY_DN1486_c0_g1~~TRINITY_DN1486_c0_g1_i1.p1  ORF type:complete len:103 (+),score=12.08 TRINITY_DN1486_c0_g1_i1:33-341(+)
MQLARVSKPSLVRPALSRGSRVAWARFATGAVHNWTSGKGNYAGRSAFVQPSVLHQVFHMSTAFVFGEFWLFWAFWIVMYIFFVYPIDWHAWEEADQVEEEE